MKNVKKIYQRLTYSLVKSRVLPIALTVQNIILSLVVLIFANVIISNGKVRGELNYNQIKNFYNFVILVLFLLVIIFTPYFLSGKINSMVKNNTLEYLLSFNVTIPQILTGVFLRGFSNVMVLVISTFPIGCISLYFGGIGLIRIARILITLLFFTFLMSSLCLCISTIVKDINVSRLFSYLVELVLFICLLFFFNYIFSVNFYLFVYVIIVIALSIILLILSSKIRVLN